MDSRDLEELFVPKSIRVKYCKISPSCIFPTECYQSYSIISQGRVISIPLLFVLASSRTTSKLVENNFELKVFGEKSSSLCLYFNLNEYLGIISLVCWTGFLYSTNELTCTQPIMSWHWSSNTNLSRIRIIWIIVWVWISF